MPNTVTVLFRRDPSRDRQENDVPFEGYRIFWTDGRPADVALDAFCKHGQRLLGLGRHLRGRHERLLDLLCFHLANRDEDMTRLPGHRVRRFFLRRTGSEGRIHFLDGTPTAIVFDLENDEERALNWIGLPDLAEGEERWFDLAARPTDEVPVPTISVSAQAAPYEASL
jgi:hypothetical protein